MVLQIPRGKLCLVTVQYSQLAELVKAIEVSSDHGSAYMKSTKTSIDVLGPVEL